jgi:hypothetical protein
LAVGPDLGEGNDTTHKEAGSAVLQISQVRRQTGREKLNEQRRYLVDEIDFSLRRAGSMSFS